MTQVHCPVCNIHVTLDKYNSCPRCGRVFTPQENSSTATHAEEARQHSAESVSPIVLAEKQKGRLTGARLAIRQGVVIGRADETTGPVDVDLSGFSGNAVSRRHARLYPDGGIWHLQDMDSKYGTFRNGQRVFADPVLLARGDTLAFGNLLFLVE